MHRKQNNKESKTFVQGLRPFGNTLPRGMRGILKKNGFNYSEIISKWSLLVGKEISEYAQPKVIKMRQGNTNGTLVLSIARGNEINIEYSKNEIINKINSHFGYKLINKIKVQTLNFHTKKTKNINKQLNLSNNLETKIKNIKNENIRNSLLEFFKTIKNV
jgi:hypothetical protein